MGNEYGIAFVRDISERKKAEELINQKNVELEAALKYNTELTSMIAHDLRSPMVPIVGYTDLLLSGSIGDLPEFAIEPLNAIKTGVNELTVLVEDFLMLTRLNRGSLEINREKISICDDVRLLITQYRIVKQPKPVVIRQMGDDFEFEGDHIRINQVLRNLIDNAIKYSRESVEINIVTSKDEHTGTITVSDNGFGIDDIERQKIFEPFYRVSGKETRGIKGSGLGLAIVSELCRLMDASISVDSEPGKGSTFRIEFQLFKETR